MTVKTDCSWCAIGYCFTHLHPLIMSDLVDTRPTLTLPFKNKRDVPAVENKWKLSPMEWAVMTRYAQGLDGAEVAKSLSLSVKTVNTYTQRAREKMITVTESGHPPSMVLACIHIDRYVNGELATKASLKGQS